MEKYKTGSLLLGGVLVSMISWGNGFSLRAQDPAEGLSAPMVSLSAESGEGDVGVSPGPATTGEKPVWRVRAERLFEEGIEAESAGKTRLARKKYGKVLKLISGGVDDETLVSLRPEIASLLFPAGGDSLLPSGDFLSDGEEVQSMVSEADSSVELSPIVSTRTYAMTIDPEDPLVEKYVALYTGRLRDRTQAAFDRMGLYHDFISQAITEEKMPRSLIYLPVVESEYLPFAVSRAGAVGMWQFMSGTAKYAGLKINYWVDERRDPEKSTRAALRTLKSLYDWFDDWHLALAAYNRGMYGIQRDLEFTRSTDFSLLSKRQGIPRETEQYVPKLMALVLIGDNAEKYGLRPPRPTRLPPPDVVLLERPLDLKVAAACAGVSESVIRELNPSVRLWVTPNNEPNFKLRIPAGTEKKFRAALAQVKDWTPSPGFVRYKVQRGDFLGRIAKRYRTTASAIQRENKIPNPNRLRPGQTLVIRPGRGFKGE
ncbi:MAG: transglycosylase SLT domain-containing protein [Elusimicrobia bacterium]|jgi:hypothetical protein|nr:transglycosylase SLT domain-containing protein [Elusimicrobiota bacterium]